jgi:N-acyl-D-aspartate/D-glutamate deacylase
MPTREREAQWSTLVSTHSPDASYATDVRPSTCARRGDAGGAISAMTATACGKKAITATSREKKAGKLARTDDVTEKSMTSSEWERDS